MSPNSKAFMTPSEFRRLSGLGSDEIYRRLHTRELPSLRVGNRFLIPARALDLLVDRVLAPAFDPGQQERAAGNEAT